MIGLKIISLNRLLLGAIPTVLICIAALIVLFSTNQMKGKYYLFEKSKAILNESLNHPILASPKSIVEKYSKIFDINNRQGVWDLWHYFLGNQFDYHGLIKPAGWWDAFPYRSPHDRPSDELYKLGLEIYRFSFKEPWIYFTWNPVYFLFLFPLALLFFKVFPLSAIFSTIVLAQMAVILVVINLNWRYYYFAYLSCFFIFPVMMLDVKSKLYFFKSPR